MLLLASLLGVMVVGAAMVPAMMDSGSDESDGANDPEAPLGTLSDTGELEAGPEIPSMLDTLDAPEGPGDTPGVPEVTTTDDLLKAYTEDLPVLDELEGDEAGIPVATTLPIPEDADLSDTPAPNPAGNAGEQSGVSVNGDILTGNDEDNVITAGAGDNQIGGYGGNDIIDAGSGDDVAYGGEGDDTLYGAGGMDSLIGEDGDDLLFGGAGDDHLAGSNGDDLLDGEAGDDSLLGGDGADTLAGGAGDDALQGGFGNDIIAGGVGQDTLMGGWGDDVLSGVEVGADGTDQDGRDFLNGGQGDDTLFAGSGDFVSGGSGADVVLVGDWIATDAAEVSDFDLSEDRLVVVYDDGAGAPAPDLDLSVDAEDPNVLNVTLNGVTIAALDGATGMTLDDIALVGQSEVADAL